MYEVEWCSHIPVCEETGESDFDRSVMESRDYKQLSSARRFARQVAPKDQFGEVHIRKFEMVPYRDGWPGEYREYDDDFIEYVHP